ncbi:MAG: hypothetical protein L6437_05240 [Kiritimatiellae bacterium]|nr:hypothetical protein [Kiritimatiellia bacterium]
MKIFVFQLFICFSMVLYSFAGNPTNVSRREDSTPIPNPTSIPPPTSELPPGFVLDKPAQSPRTNELMPWEMDWSVSNKASEETTVTQNKPTIPGKGFTWVDEEPVGAVGNLFADIMDPIPPPITNGFNVIFPELYNNNHYLVMTNAQYSGRNRRTLSFSRFTSTGLESISLDVTRIHPTILEYLNISRDRVIQEDKEIKRRQVQQAINNISQKTRKLKIQIESLDTIADEDVQENAIIAAIDVIDVIDKIYDAMDATLNTMDMVDQIQPKSAESETITAMFTTVKWALDSMTAIHRERAKQDAEMSRQRKLISYQEYLRGLNEREAIRLRGQNERKNRPTSIEVNSTEELTDRWGNTIYKAPKSSVVNFNYDK